MAKRAAVGYLHLRPYLDRLSETSECTQRGDSLAGSSLQFGQLPATEAAALQDALRVPAQLWDVHECP